MKIWMIAIKADDGFIWIESAMDDELTSSNPKAWEADVRAARRLVEMNPSYEMRILSATIPGVYEAFDNPELKGTLD